MEKIKVLGIEQIFTSYDNHKGNQYSERLIRTIKEELLWLEEFESLAEAQKKIGAWVERYNREYLHSSLDYMSPEEFLRQWEEQEALLCLA